MVVLLVVVNVLLMLVSMDVMILDVVSSIDVVNLVVINVLLMSVSMDVVSFD